MYDSTWMRAYNNKNVYTAGEMKAGTMTQMSSAEYKDNIALYTDYATSIVKNTPIYRYNHKKSFDPANWNRRKTGFVIDESVNSFPSILKSGNDGVDLYAAIGVLWKSQQETVKEIEALKNEVNQLKGAV